jgi:undecaprenyl phosphate-alpha-L-ara4FN deformylase
MVRLALKVDVDTERGTLRGVPALLHLLKKYHIPATFLFSLGPDNTGRALKRIFRPGFLKKVSRTSVIQVYGIKTLLNGVLWPGPHISHLHGDILRATKLAGHEVGIHCYDHVYWQDNLASMTSEQVSKEVKKAQDAFVDVFKYKSLTAGSAGWQANENSLKAYDDQGFLYASDSRGSCPFFPRVGHTLFKTLQIPTTLPTLDELYGRPEFPTESLVDHYLQCLNPDGLNVLTIHAELEGMAFVEWFESLLRRLTDQKVEFVTLEDEAHKLLKNPELIPICDLIQGEVDGRSGLLACQDVNPPPAREARLHS